MQEYIDRIKYFAKKIKRDIKLMEVCGTHTQVIAEYGIKEFLPKNIKLISGPGCPVCVTAIKDIDAVVKLAMSGIPVATYGDIIRVKGSKMSLADAREAGAFVKEIYGVEELFSIKEGSDPFGGGQTPYSDTVFFGIGFETTAPMTASAVKRETKVYRRTFKSMNGRSRPYHGQGVAVYSAHKAFIPAMEALLREGEIKVDGLISPGHVGTIVGADAFCGFKIPPLSPHYKGGELVGCRDEAFAKTADGLPRLRNIPQVITGFAEEDVLRGIMMLLEQIADGRSEVENEYKRVVANGGNKKALKLIDEVFEIKDSEWRGLGNIPNSGFELREKYADMDAKVVYKGLLTQINTDVNTDQHRSSCLCAEVIKGNIEPQRCPNFGKKCNPEDPQGPCMVSREGACAIAYRII